MGLSATMSTVMAHPAAPRSNTICASMPGVDVGSGGDVSMPSVGRAAGVEISDGLHAERMVNPSSDTTAKIMNILALFMAT